MEVYFPVTACIMVRKLFQKHLTSNLVSFITTIAVEKLSRNIPFLIFKNDHLISDLNVFRLYLFVLVNCG